MSKDQLLALAERCETRATNISLGLWNEYGVPNLEGSGFARDRQEAAELFTIAAALKARAHKEEAS
jgi:hypothetical protein